MTRDLTRREVNTLTNREVDVLRELCTGKSNIEIGLTLFLAPETIKSYVSRLRMKLGATNRVQVVNAAYAQGIVACPCLDCKDRIDGLVSSER